MAHKLASEAALCYNKLRNNVALAMLETSQGWISLYERNTMNTLPPRAQDDNPPQKRCPKCHRWLPFSAFSTANAAKDGLYWRCRECKPSLARSEEHTSELQSHSDLVCRLLLEKKKKTNNMQSVAQLVYEPLVTRAR